MPKTFVNFQHFFSEFSTSIYRKYASVKFEINVKISLKQGLQFEICVCAIRSEQHELYIYKGCVVHKTIASELI